MSETMLVTLTFTALSSILFLLVGFGIGWLAQGHAIKSNPYHRDNLHPEMYDEHGNVIPDEILALRFENADTFNSTEFGGDAGEDYSSERPEEEDD